MTQPTPAKPPRTTPRQAIRNQVAKHGNPLRSKVLGIAFGIMFIGAIVWGFAAATRPRPAPNATPATATAPGVTGLTASADDHSVTIKSEERLIDQSGPAAFRLGLSFAVGYFVAWGVRAFLKVTMLFFGAVGAGLALLTHYHVFGLDWGVVQSNVESSFAYLQGQAGHVKDLVMGYLPSTASGVAGTIFGFRKHA